jgi:drug/metabolite transporter (DMT)-like permease
VGVASNSWGGTFLASGIVGLVQVVIVTAFELSHRKLGLFKDFKGALGSSIFGILALSSTVLGFATFMKGGDISTSTFIVTLSIVPGMLIDIIFFHYKSTIREWIGMSVAIFAGYTILGLPRLEEILKMPLWFWLAIGNMMTVAINQGITQAVKKVDPLFKNFWGGLMALIFAPLLMIAIGQGGSIVRFNENVRIWYASFFIGIIVIAMWSFNLLSYQCGASIALKKLVMNATYLTSTLIIGVLFFHEKITVGKVLALPLFCCAFILMDQKMWNYVTSTLARPARA